MLPFLKVSGLRRKKSRKALHFWVFFFKCIYFIFRETETAHVAEGQTDREEERENSKQLPTSGPELDVGHEHTKL